MLLHAVLLCGGSGTRLWPLSRGKYPKQFLALNGDTSLLQQTVQRARAVEPQVPVIAVANQEHRFLVAQQLFEVGVSEPSVLIEPAVRNTAPAVAVAAMTALQHDPEAVLLVMPSDHAMSDDGVFREAVEAGLPAARDGSLVTFGVRPTRPETGYGYIRHGGGSDRVQDVAAFVEKPDAATAQQYLDAGTYLWNSGIFLMGARTYLDELARWRPSIHEAAEASFLHAGQDLNFLRLNVEAFESSPSESIDFAVMENTDRAVVVPLDCGWSDLGSWSQLAELAEPDGDGNVLVGDVMAEETANSYIRSSGRLVATLGVSNQVVVETSDAVLVADRERVQDVKRIVERLGQAGRSEAGLHRCVYRPWGSYEGLATGSRYQVKHIVVTPGQRLSVQMHHHRAEHWVVVSGTARVYCGDESFLITENESTYIPLGTTHSLENPGVIPLELIEVQSGAYLGEDDIVRFDDVYGRAEHEKS
ncbi:MAG: mannose-1-phosphate guanylyltransferase/mannose-6-phosphate isomerase [Spiribacter salinus]|uniref:mannose-1-phosphate guanylyltransferase n=1 Tax=Spiribacter salinus TaxID=1335746 RepID=A0A540VTT7_9GAMM|nr:MAG: mannose-1-phosphate guanylyltransferase/mannose-6-phosphate isomerase [Spiribacter salinus]